MNMSNTQDLPFNSVAKNEHSAQVLQGLFPKQSTYVLQHEPDEPEHFASTKQNLEEQLQNLNLGQEEQQDTQIALESSFAVVMQTILKQTSEQEWFSQQAE